MSLIANYLLSFLTYSRIILYFILLYPLHFLSRTSQLMPRVVLFVHGHLIMWVCKVLSFWTNLIGLYFCHLIVFCIHLVSELLPFWHMPWWFTPLLLTDSELCVLLSELLSSLIGPVLLIIWLIHVENIDVLVTFVLNVSLARNSLEFLDNELFWLSFLKFPTAHIQLIDVFNDIELMTCHCYLVFVILWFSFILKVHWWHVLTISLCVTVNIRVWRYVKALPLKRAFSNLCISLY